MHVGQSDMHVGQSDAAAGEEELESGMDVKTEAVTKNAAEAVAKVKCTPLAHPLVSFVTLSSVIVPPPQFCSPPLYVDAVDVVTSAVDWRLVLLMHFGDSSIVHHLLCLAAATVASVEPESEVTKLTLLSLIGCRLGQLCWRWFHLK